MSSSNPEEAAGMLDIAEAKEQLFDRCRGRGALAVGVADMDLVHKVAPPGHRPRDLMPTVRSVISVGVGGPTQGAWFASAKALSFIGDTEKRAYKIAYGLAYHIEARYGYRSIFCPPDVDPEQGARVPLQSVKLHAELAGIGARSLAGDILLHPEYGFMYYGSVFTEMPLPPDQPMAENPCPAPSCVSMYRQSGQTPCMKFCPVNCLRGKIDAQGRVEEMEFEMYRCAEMTQQYEAVPNILAEALRAESPETEEEVLFGAENQVIWYKMAIGEGELLAQCFECMRVCPIATQAPQADPIRRGRPVRLTRNGEILAGRSTR
jgi:epoxyqueuosine reductase QueG